MVRGGPQTCVYDYTPPEQVFQDYGQYKKWALEKITLKMEEVFPVGKSYEDLFGEDIVEPDLVETIFPLFASDNDDCGFVFGLSADLYYMMQDVKEDQYRREKRR